MKKSGIAILLMLLATGSLLGQETLNYGQNLRSLLNDKMAEQYGNNKGQQLYSEDFSKNPFLFKDWNYARIVFTDGQVVDSLMINYDDKADDLLVTMAEGVDPFTVKTNQVESFTFYHLPGRPYIAKPDSDFEENDKKRAFYEQLYGTNEGNGTTVLKQLVKKYRDAEDQINYGSVKAESKFDLFTRYYVKAGDGKFKKISLNKKGFQVMIGKDNIKAAQALLKKNKLKWSDEAAVALVLNEYL